MSTSLTSLNHSQSNDEFFNKLASHQQGAKPAKPIYIRLDGKTGIYNEVSFSEAEKKTVKTQYGDGNKFEAAILLIKWFASDRFKEGGSQTKRRTREFSSFRDEPIEYIEIDFTKKGEQPKVIATLNGYDVFKEYVKEEYGKKVIEAMANKEDMPNQKDYQPELWASVYLYEFVSNRIINLKLKGTSRKAVFDYLGSWNKRIEMPSISQVLTQFSSSYFTEPQPYYCSTLNAVRALEEGEQAKVKEAIMALISWMKSFDTAQETAEAVVEVSTSDTGEIRLEDIPF